MKKVSSERRTMMELFREVVPSRSCAPNKPRRFPLISPLQTPSQSLCFLSRTHQTLKPSQKPSSLLPSFQMGRYMRKPKTSGEALGVLTRSKTLALQKQQNPKPDLSSPNSSCYLELRSRKLEKQPVLVKGKGSLCGEAGPDSTGKTAVANSCSVGSASFGENLFENGRNTRESTPCSFIRDSDSLSTPCSTNRRKTTFRFQRNSEGFFPSTFEMEEFFSSAEQLQQQLFMDKYNFDPVNEIPLSGRYQWVKVDS
ncbi:hypothetical protein LUZ60_016299 [Juncus effusus]|nr:hypothetical protein LUZ60_016299 [Juncus effusus]